MRRMDVLIFLLVLLNVVYSVSGDEDPEAYMSDLEMIQYWGYPAEVHDVVTEDGYILDLFRIPHGRFSETNTSCHRPVVLLVHGLLGAAPMFFLNPPESSSAFILADAGFDVFLLNQRGTTYGKRHKSMTPSDNKFWQFSLDEFAKYDAPAVIDKTLALTGETQLYWIGDSQGTLVGFMALAETPAYNSKVKTMFQVTPVGTSGYSKGAVRFLYLGYNIFKPLLDLYRNVLGSHEFLPGLPFLFRPLSRLCELIPILGPEACYDGLFLGAGHPSKTFNASRIPVYVSHVPCGTSTWNILHWGQIATRLKVEHMDHNPIENARRYGQLTPPPYNYSKIAALMYLFWSRNDWLATKKDIDEIILKNLPKGIVKGSFEVPGYNHLDFGVATDVADKVYFPIVNIVRSQESSMCAR